MKTRRSRLDKPGLLPTFLGDRSMAIVAGGSESAYTTFEMNPTGRYGVAVAEIGCNAGTALAGTPSDHTLGVFKCRPARTRHTIAGKQSDHVSETGSLCVCPAGADFTTDYEAPVQCVLLQISTECLAVAGAQLGRHNARLIEQMNGRDDRLRGMAEAMLAQARSGNTDGTIWWSSMADAMLRHLATHHLSDAILELRGRLGIAALRRLDSFIQDRLHTGIDLADLAAVIACDQYHFAHRFRATVGVSPYRYVVRCRLERARQLLRHARQPIAEIAAATGFADQSHLTNWMRRVYGATPAQFRAVICQ